MIENQGVGGLASDNNRYDAFLILILVDNQQVAICIYNYLYKYISVS